MRSDTAQRKIFDNIADHCRPGSVLFEW
jgi:O-methyltransferase involved in polyketide biosynthesis